MPPLPSRSLSVVHGLFSPLTPSTGGCAEVSEHLLPCEGLPEAHPSQGDPVQDWEGLQVCAGEASLRPEAERVRWSDQARVPQEGTLCTWLSLGWGGFAQLAVLSVALVVWVCRATCIVFYRWPRVGVIAPWVDRGAGIKVGRAVGVHPASRRWSHVGTRHGVPRSGSRR